MYNIAIDHVVNNHSVLPRLSYSNGLVIFKLKRNSTFNGHVFFEAVRPHFVKKFVYYLLENNFSYINIDTNFNNIPEALLRFDANNESINVLLNNIDQERDIILEDQHFNDIDLNALMSSSNETVLIAEILSESDMEGTFSLTAGEGKLLISKC